MLIKRQTSMLDVAGGGLSLSGVRNTPNSFGNVEKLAGIVSQVDKNKVAMAKQEGAQAKQEERKAEQSYNKALANQFKFANAGSDLSMQEMYSNNETNPEELSKQLTSIQEKTAASFEDEEMKNAYILDSTVSKAAYVRKAQGNFDKLQTKKQKESGLQGISGSLQVLETSSSSYFDGDKDTGIIAQKQISAINQEMNALNDDGTSRYTPSEKETFMKDIDKAKVIGFKNNIDTIFASNTNEGMKYADTVLTDSQGYMKKYNLNRDQYDKMKTYAKSLKTAFKEKGGKVNPKTGKPFTDQDIFDMNNARNDALQSHEIMNISKKDGVDVVQNEDTDNFTSLVSLQEKFQTAADLGALKELGAATKMADANAALYEKIKEVGTDDTSGILWWKSQKPADEQLAVMTNNMGGSNYEKTVVFSDAYRTMEFREIDMESSDPKVKKEVSKIFNSARDDYYALKYANAPKGQMIAEVESFVGSFSEPVSGAKSIKKPEYKLIHRNGKVYQTLKNKDGSTASERYMGTLEEFNKKYRS